MEIVGKIIPDYDFKIKSYEKIFDLLKKESIKEKIDVKTFSASLPKELVEPFDKCFLNPLPAFGEFISFDKEIKSVAKELNAMDLKEKIRNLSEKMKSIPSGKEEEKTKLKNEFQKLTARLSA